MSNVHAQYGGRCVLLATLQGTFGVLEAFVMIVCDPDSNYDPKRSRC
jgi:hypothetical protein